MTNFKIALITDKDFSGVTNEGRTISTASEQIKEFSKIVMTFNFKILASNENNFLGESFVRSSFFIVTT